MGFHGFSTGLPWNPGTPLAEFEIATVTLLDLGEDQVKVVGEYLTGRSYGHKTWMSDDKGGSAFPGERYEGLTRSCGNHVWSFASLFPS